MFDSLYFNSSLFRSLLVLGIMLLMLLLQRFVFKTITRKSDTVKLIRQSINAAILLFGLLAFVISLPFDHAVKGQILSFLGIILSAAIALSSTNILGNLIAGFMNNSMDRFKRGDLIKIGDITGRVTKKSIFHIEIQLEDSNFMTIPNLHIASNPVQLIRQSKTVISTQVSLGYDVSRPKIEECLKAAATQIKLTDPYVYITHLGDFSVSYKIHGFLEGSNKYFSTSSALNAAVVDALHAADIEIVSPSFMNQRQVTDKTFIPPKTKKTNTEEPENNPEEMVFDKAMDAMEIEKKRELLASLIQKKDLLKQEIKQSQDSEKMNQLKFKMKRIELQMEKLDQIIRQETQQIDKES